MNNAAPNWGGLNAAEVEPTESFDALPAGDYPVMIEKAEWKQTKAGTGHYLELAMAVLDGQYKGRKVWDRLNLVNPNTQTVEIAQRTLSAICRAVGVQHVDTNTVSQVCGKPLIAKLKVDGDNNAVKGYKPAGGAPVQPGSATTQEKPSQEQSAPAQQSGGAAPWGNR